MTHKHDFKPSGKFLWAYYAKGARELLAMKEQVPIDVCECQTYSTKPFHDGMRVELVLDRRGVNCGCRHSINIHDGECLMKSRFGVACDCKKYQEAK